jgi:pyruvate kinase
MIQAGMDIARLNLSHGTHEDHRLRLQSLREAARSTRREVALLLDLQGPKIRIGAFGTASIELKAGDHFAITTEPVTGDKNKVSTTYSALARDVSPGKMILLDDGKLKLRVLQIKGREVECEVEVGGVLSANKGINLPGVAVSAPSVTDKDLGDLQFGLEQDVDYVALSFVRSADDIRHLREAIVKHIAKGKFLPVIAKIEKPQAVENIDAIISETDGIMIARGDLGVELPPEEVPILQKMIIKKCNEAGKPVVVATQMLESMIQNPSPTRAETSDVANAVLDGCDAVMLSGETSVGRFPVEAIQIMSRIVEKVEADLPAKERLLDRPLGTVESRLDALGRAACVLAEQTNAAAIVAVTRTGNTARVLARYRPQPKIVAVTDRLKILRRLQLIWGVHGVLMERLDEDSDKALQEIQERLLQLDVVRHGEFVVLLAGQPFFARGSTNFIKVEKIE